MKRYTLLRVGDLLITKVAIKGPQGVRVLALLVDTGSTYTILPEEALKSIGYDPSVSQEQVDIITGSGHLRAPAFQVEWVQALGKKVKQFKAVAHTLPTGLPIDGLLGMDFLRRIRAKLDLGSGTAEVP